ncbi:hypothetical protein [Tissierella sp. Yu-01]|jgi:response regulator RpfG family c-di-GMP phosphodiesterase|nr:hypothetical protein [Tissierella sp. Yu-01]WFA09333.1 hypothetical protein P3962_01800 [Tissierella sp. Yu-01]
MTNELNKNSIGKYEAIMRIKKEAGIKYDPEIVEIFVKIMGNSMI